MSESNLKKDCLPLSKACVYGTKQSDGFVGIRYDKGNVKVIFPFGYSVPESADEKIFRKDVLNLVKVLSRFANKSNVVEKNYSIKDESVQLPIHAYIHVFSFFLDNGYYVEKESVYKKGVGGKINWPKTIKRGRPKIAGNYPNESAVYFDFITKKSLNKENELITQIHKFCVYEAYEKLINLLGYSQPEKPTIPFNAAVFSAVVRSKLDKTFNEKYKRLFKDMLDIIQFHGMKTDDCKTSFGTRDFEYVWEKLIDHVFGIKEKNKYYPKCSWSIFKKNGNIENANVKSCEAKQTTLRPDAIMELKECKKIFVLDAKYYQYGDDGKNKSGARDPKTLPGSESILKQIAYAEFIETVLREQKNENSSVVSNDSNQDDKQKVDREHIFNAFILPYAANENDGKSYCLENFGYAKCEWRLNTVTEKSYDRIYGILLDVRSIMQRHPFHSDDDMANLSRVILEKVPERFKC